MPTLQTLIEARIASREWDAAALGRFRFWADQLGHLPIADISEDHVDTALAALAERGRLQPSSRGTKRTGQPLAPSTVNRYISTLGGLFKYARKLRHLPRSHVPPTKGIERGPEPMNPDRYLRPEQVQRLVR